MTADPLIREALSVSSGSLAGTIAKVQDGRQVARAKLERAAFAVTRYLLRMTGRPTPFGLMAGVQRVTFVDTAEVRVGDQHHKAVRPDSAWLSAELAALLRSPAVRDACMVTANNLCAVRGDRLVQPYVRHVLSGQDGDGEPAREVSVRYSPVVQMVMQAARRPLGYPRLREAILAAFPQASAEDADRLLSELIDREILLTDLLARRDQPDQLGMVNRQLAHIDEPGPASLRRLGEMLADYEAADIGEGLGLWRTAVAAMGDRGAAGDRPPVQVDLRVDVDVRLPHAVRRELADAGNVLWRLAPPADGQPQLTEYHHAFLERYGQHSLVPVLDVLDPHIGLGPPAGYRVPRGERAARQPPADPFPASREQLVAALAMQIIQDGGDELVLDDDLVARLAHDETATPPLSFDLCAEIHADCAEALDRGDFQLVISAGTGSFAAGAMAGRFARLLDAGEALGAVIGQQASPEGPLLAQLYFQPRNARYDNVALVPRLLPHTVPVGTFDDFAASDVIDVRDLAVGADGDRLYLLAAKSGREVVVVTPHMLEFRTSAPNVARFLAAMSMSGTRPLSPWQWGRLEALPWLPRVRYRRTVLTPCRWRPPPVLRDRHLSWSAWQRALQQWRERCRVPAAVRVYVLDHHVDLDLTVPLHQQLLRSQLCRPSTTPDSVMVRESRCWGEGWVHGHANEIVVPLVSATSRAPAPGSDARPAIRVRHHPGGDWLFAKVYAVSDMHDLLLHRDIPELLRELPEFVDRWFFVRYLDPLAHLRLRFHGPADQLNRELLVRLNRWAEGCCAAGAIRGIQLDGYEPEVQRYGGPGAIEDAERLFHADSEAVVTQLTERARGGLPIPLEILAAMNYADLLRSLRNWDWTAWVLRRFPAGLQHQIGAHRETAISYIDPAGHWSRLREQPCAQAVLTGWARRAAAAARYGRHIEAGVVDDHAVESLLHLHANRLLGMDEDAEKRSYGLLRAAARAHAGRLRAAGQGPR